MSSAWARRRDIEIPPTADPLRFSDSPVVRFPFLCLPVTGRVRCFAAVVFLILGNSILFTPPSDCQSATRLAPGDLLPSSTPQIPHSQNLGTSPAPSSSQHALGAARPAIMLAGYWPPSNEAIRRFSPNSTQNPQGWIGSNWEGRGYDIYAYFPEFSPSACTNCGKGTGDLEVDYQDTSNDFFPLANAIRPIAIITFSRGFIDMSWELEMNQFNRVTWIPDFQAPTSPTPSPPDASAPMNFLRPSTLPVQEIRTAVNSARIGVQSRICFSGDGGGFLSEYMAYHGVWYQSLHSSPQDPAYCVTAGHVHVGGQIPWGTARQAAEITVRTVIDYVNTIVGPPMSSLTTCGIGGVNAGCGQVEDVLFVNGQTGGTGRILNLRTNQGISVTVSEPTSRRGDSVGTRLCVYAFGGIPGVTDEIFLPLGFGGMCFGPASMSTRAPLVTWNSIGRRNQLGPHTAFGIPPVVPDSGSVTLVSRNGGLGIPVTLTLQGIIEDDCSAASVPFSITNGMVVKIE